MADDYFEPYSDPEYWGKRGPIYSGKGTFAKLFNVYGNFNDNGLRKRLSTVPGTRLDAGCGEGRLLQYATMGVDFSPGMLKRAKEKGVPIVRASVLALPFRDKAFRFAFTTDVIVHLRPEEKVSAAKELGRISSRYVDFGAERRTLYYRIRALLPRRRAFSFVALALSLYADRLMARQEPLVVDRHGRWPGTRRSMFKATRGPF